MSTRPTGTCSCCGHTGPLTTYGWILRCYERWRIAGYPPGGPPPPFHAAAERYERYLSLRRRNYTVRESAQWLGISERQAQRYEARRREQARQAAA